MEPVAGTSQSTNVSFSRNELVNILRNCTSKNYKMKCEHLYEEVKKATGSCEFPKEIKEALWHFVSQFKTKWIISKRCYKRFSKKNQSWLEGSIEFPINRVDSRRGRPSTDFSDSSERSKRRKTEGLRSQFSSEELSYGAQMEFRRESKVHAATVIKDIVFSTPKRASKYKEAYKKAGSVVRPFTHDEALSLTVEAKLTKFQYNVIRNAAKAHGSQLYPNYEAVTATKKLCYPENINIGESIAEVPLQCLLNHTVNRLLQCQEEVVNSLRPEQLSDVHLISKWGCDGTSGLSAFKQKSEDPSVSDESMFVISFVPIRLVSRDLNTNKEIVLWQNPRPSSPRFCRPIRLQFIHETTTVIKDQVTEIENQIKALTPTVSEITNSRISVHHKLLFTMIDGKVCNAVSENLSTQRCYLCGLTSKNFNNIELVSKQSIEDKSKLRFGISPLHAWIRCFECILHVSYKLVLLKWQAHGNEEKQKVAVNQKEIQARFKSQMGLIVDKVKAGYGNSNDGNTARRFFEDAETTAEITNVNEEIIKRFRVILLTISSTYSIKLDYFKKYCSETAEKFVELYPWYPMSTTVHKILFHSTEIIKYALLPIGQLGEEAQEARHKDVKRYRELYSRKFSRQKTMEDVFHNLLISSDPYITSLRKLSGKGMKKYSPEVIQFFDLPSDIDFEMSEDKEDNSD